jgi:hypothetical protein
MNTEPDRRLVEDIYNHGLTGHPLESQYGKNVISESVAKLQAERDRAIAEAQTNAVAWAIGVIDEMHIGEIADGQLGKGTVGDKGYKAIKNTIRDLYKTKAGLDPAPSYPIKAKLRSQTTGEKGGGDGNI